MAEEICVLGETTKVLSECNINTLLPRFLKDPTSTTIHLGQCSSKRFWAAETGLKRHWVGVSLEPS